jgi:hypothetical protein
MQSYGGRWSDETGLPLIRNALSAIQKSHPSALSSEWSTVVLIQRLDCTLTHYRQCGDTDDHGNGNDDRIAVLERILRSGIDAMGALPVLRQLSRIC